MYLIELKSKKKDFFEKYGLGTGIEDLAIQKGHLNSFINYLRTLRDVIPKSSLSNPYKIIHYEKGYKVYKNLKPLYDIKTKTWSPDDQVYGTLKNHIQDMSDKTIENIIYIIHIKREKSL